MKELTEFMKCRWSEILKIPEYEIQVEDSFLQLGGTALSMYKFLYQLELYFNKKINKPLFVKCTTLYDMGCFLLENEQAFDTKQ